jgi:phage gp16-like protein
MQKASPGAKVRSQDDNEQVKNAEQAEKKRQGWIRDKQGRLHNKKQIFGSQSVVTLPKTVWHDSIGRTNAAES